MTTFSTPDLSDAAPQARAIELAFGNYGAVKVFSGQAVTIKCHEDNSLVKQAVGEAGEGRVLVVDGGGSRRRALPGWLSLVSFAMSTRLVLFLSACRPWVRFRSRRKNSALASVISP
jgi:regulator of RNase E activity RraA